MVKSYPRVAFVDFWPDFIAEESYLYKVLRDLFGVVISDEPDYVFYSVFGQRHWLGLDHGNGKFENCVKILWTGENFRPDFGVYDFALSFDHSDDLRNCRWPIYVETLAQVEKFTFRADFPTNLVWQGVTYPQPPGTSLVWAATTTEREAWAKARLAEKTKFCNFVYSNPGCSERNRFFELLSQYKKVDSGGRFCNNVGGPVVDKWAFRKDYKFTIAFENSSRAGYTTEKVVDAMLAHTVPIYWGNPDVGADFNAYHLVNCHDYASFEKVIEAIIELDRDDELYVKKLAEPCFADNKPNIYCEPSYLAPFFERVFSKKRSP